MQDLKLITKNLFLLASLFVVFAVIFWRGLFAEVQYWDEGTNIAVMAESSPGELRLNGENFFEKPPLYYWLGIFLLRIFKLNFNEFVILMRCISLSCAVSLIFMVYKIYHKKIAATFTLCLLCLPFLWQVIAGNTLMTHHFLSVDADSIFILSIVSFYFCFDMYLKMHKSKYLVFSAIFVGVGVMLKGPLPLMIMLLLNLIYYIRIKPRSYWRELLLQIGIITAVVAPWHVYMISRFGWAFAEIYAGYHLFGRVVTSLENHSGSILFYFIKFIGLMTFVAFVLSATKLSGKRWYNRELVVGFVLLALLSLMQTKLIWYAFPAVIMLIIGTSKILAAWPKRYFYLISIGLTVLAVANLLNLQEIPNGFHHKNDATIAGYLSPKKYHVVMHAYQVLNGLDLDSQYYLIDLHESNPAEFNNLTILSENYALVQLD